MDPPVFRHNKYMTGVDTQCLIASYTPAGRSKWKLRLKTFYAPAVFEMQRCSLSQTHWHRFMEV